MKRIFFVIMLFVAACAYADVPNEITYQGRLREYGQPVNATRTMNFKIYDHVTGPVEVWESGNVSVDVTSGTFSYVMAPVVDWRQKDYWIETVISGKTLSPREKITSQIYALHSRTAEDISKKAGDNISFVIGTSTKATISSSGEVSSLVNGATFYMVPRGAIIMWSGSIAAIPTGWDLCDGTNGTPDLRDRFVMSVANSSDNPGTIGGANSYTLSVAQLPAHSHTGSTDVGGAHNHGGITSTDGNHVHTYAIHQNDLNSDDVGNNTGFHGAWRSDTTTNTGSAGAHSHTIADAPNHTHSFTTNTSGSGSAIDNRPAFYRLAFIMKL